MDRKNAAARRPQTSSDPKPERPTPDEQTCRLARIMARLAAKDDEIAAALETSEATLNEWKRGCADFAKAI